MTWPSDVVPTTNMDAGTDSPASARAAIKTMADVVNDIVAYGEPALKSNFDTLDTDYAAHEVDTDAHSATSAATANRIALRDASGNINIGNASAAAHAMNRTTADARYGLYETSSSSPGTDFTSGTIRWARVGKMVTISWTNMGHSSAVSATSSAVIPSDFRPSENIYGVVYSSGEVHLVLVYTTGRIRIQYRDWDGNLTSRTGAIAGSISYVLS